MILHTVVVSFSKLKALSQPSWFVTESSFSIWVVDGSGSKKKQEFYWWNMRRFLDKPSSLSDVSPLILNAIRFISANCWGSGAPRPASTDSITALKPSPK